MSQLFLPWENECPNCFCTCRLDTRWGTILVPFMQNMNVKCSHQASPLMPSKANKSVKTAAKADAFPEHSEKFHLKGTHGKCQLNQARFRQVFSNGEGSRWSCSAQRVRGKMDFRFWAFQLWAMPVFTLLLQSNSHLHCCVSTSLSTHPDCAEKSPLENALCSSASFDKVLTSANHLPVIFGYVAWTITTSQRRKVNNQSKFRKLNPLPKKIGPIRIERTFDLIDEKKTQSYVARTDVFPQLFDVYLTNQGLTLIFFSCLTCGFLQIGCPCTHWGQSVAEPCRKTSVKLAQQKKPLCERKKLEIWPQGTIAMHCTGGGVTHLWGGVGG